MYASVAFALEATGFSGKDYYTWYGTTADNVTVSWDQPSDYKTGDTFEIQLKNPERNITVNIPDATTFSKIFKCPRTGHWIVYVRTKRIVSGQPQYSNWVNSTDPIIATVNGQPRAWWLFTWIAGTGPIMDLGKGDNKTADLEEQTGNHKIVLSFNNLNEVDN
jgi:hypothetical protein